MQKNKFSKYQNNAEKKWQIWWRKNCQNNLFFWPISFGRVTWSRGCERRFQEGWLPAPLIHIVLFLYLFLFFSPHFIDLYWAKSEGPIRVLMISHIIVWRGVYTIYRCTGISFLLVFLYFVFLYFVFCIFVFLFGGSGW